MEAIYGHMEYDDGWQRPNVLKEKRRQKRENNEEQHLSHLSRYLSIAE